MRNTESAFVGACMVLASCGQPPSVPLTPTPNRDKIEYLAAKSDYVEASSYVERWEKREPYIVDGCIEDNVQCIQDAINKRKDLSFADCDAQLDRCTDDVYARRGKGSSWRDLFKCEDEKVICEDKELEKQDRWGELRGIYTPLKGCLAKVTQCIAPRLERKAIIEAMKNDPEIAPIIKGNKDIIGRSEKIWHKIMGTCNVIEESALEDASVACFENQLQKECSAQSKKLCSGDRADRSKWEWIACESQSLKCHEIYHSCIQNLHQQCFGDFGE